MDTVFVVPVLMIVLVLIFGLILLTSMIKIVREYERLVVFRFGRCIGQTLKTLGAGPATKFIFPMEFASFLKPFVNPAPNSPPGTK